MGNFISHVCRESESRCPEKMKLLPRLYHSDHLRPKANNFIFLIFFGDLLFVRKKCYDWRTIMKMLLWLTERLECLHWINSRIGCDQIIHLNAWLIFRCKYLKEFSFTISLFALFVISHTLDSEPVRNDTCQTRIYPIKTTNIFFHHILRNTENRKGKFQV